MDAIEQTKLVISELQKLPMVCENIQQIIDLVRYLRFPIVESVAENGFTIVRARRGDGYRTQSEVSYKTASLCKTAHVQVCLTRLYFIVFYLMMKDIWKMQEQFVSQNVQNYMEKGF